VKPAAGAFASSHRTGIALVDPLTTFADKGQPVQVSPLEPLIPVLLYAVVRAQKPASVAQSELSDQVRQ
jgi:hypothetical protein